LGRSCGTIFGGLFSTHFGIDILLVSHSTISLTSQIASTGTTAVLRGYGFACLFVLIGFVLINYYRPDQGGFVASLTPADDPHQVAQEMGHLVPHGVPGNPTIVRTASNTNIQDTSQVAAPQATQYAVNNGTLDTTTPVGTSHTNPFLASTAGYGTAEEEYSGISITTSSVAYGSTATNPQQAQYQSGYSKYTGHY
jgi:hypothetical protein